MGGFRAALFVLARPRRSICDRHHGSGGVRRITSLKVEFRTGSRHAYRRDFCSLSLRHCGGERVGDSCAALKRNRLAVLASFQPASYRSPMPDPEKLTPADPRDLVISIAMALTSDSRLAKAQAAEAMANVVAERIVEHLERDGFVVSRRSPASGHSALGRGFEG
jgi:hypothetical protein